MTVETKMTLTDSTIEKLQDLIQVNVDSHDGFEEVADKTDDIAVANLFRRLASERSNQASELQAIVAANCEEPEESGSYSAAAHRVLIDIRAALGGGTKVMLIEAEKGEDQIKEKYEEVMKDNPGTAVSDVLHRHYEAVKAAHDHVRDLRDKYKDG
jgi:uncharacterized protein (TIGR02284 family)